MHILIKNIGSIAVLNLNKVQLFKRANIPNEI